MDGEKRQGQEYHGHVPWKLCRCGQRYDSGSCCTRKLEGLLVFAETAYPSSPTLLTLLTSIRSKCRGGFRQFRYTPNFPAHSPSRLNFMCFMFLLVGNGRLLLQRAGCALSECLHALMRWDGEQIPCASIRISEHYKCVSFNGPM